MQQMKIFIKKFLKIMEYTFQNYVQQYVLFCSLELGGRITQIIKIKNVHFYVEFKNS